MKNLPFSKQPPLRHENLHTPRLWLKLLLKREIYTFVGVFKFKTPQTVFEFHLICTTFVLDPIFA